ncbi:hypothetical protein QFZ94_002536 [Paraburkholderia sp. JPY465]
MNLHDEIRDLRQADDAISAAQSRNGHQLELLQALERDGHSTARTRNRTMFLWLDRQTQSRPEEACPQKRLVRTLWFSVGASTSRKCREALIGVVHHC